MLKEGSIGYSLSWIDTYFISWLCLSDQLFSFLRTQNTPSLAACNPSQANYSNMPNDWFFFLFHRIYVCYVLRSHNGQFPLQKYDYFLIQQKFLLEKWKRTCHASRFLFVSPAAYIYSGKWNKRKTAWQNNKRKQSKVNFSTSFIVRPSNPPIYMVDWTDGRECREKLKQRWKFLPECGGNIFPVWSSKLSSVRNHWSAPGWLPVYSDRRIDVVI